MLWRIIFSLIVLGIFYLYSNSVAADNPIYGAMRVYVFWITLAGFILTRFMSGIVGFRGKGGQQ